MTTTEWFMPDVKPVRIGVYEVTDTPLCDWSGFQHWNGTVWSELGHTPEVAARYEGCVSCFQDHAWRGLTEQPA
jgi:hypothetical protein